MFTCVLLHYYSILLGLVVIHGISHFIHRSTAAANKLEEAGFKNVACMTSGLQAAKPG